MYRTPESLCQPLLILCATKGVQQLTDFVAVNRLSRRLQLKVLRKERLMSNLTVPAGPLALTRRQQRPPAQTRCATEYAVGRTTFENLENEEENALLEALDETEEWKIWQPPGDLAAQAEPSRWRWVIAFVIIAVLVILFSLIVFLGLIDSVWWY